MYEDRKKQESKNLISGESVKESKNLIAGESVKESETLCETRGDHVRQG